MKATAAEEHRGKKYAAILYKSALEKFKESLMSVPRDPRTLRNTADVCQHLGLNNMAMLFYHMGIQVQPDDPVSLYKYAYFLHKTIKDSKEAEIYFTKSVDRLPTVGALISFAEFCIEEEKLEQAEKLYLLAVQIFSENSVCHHHLARFSERITKDHKKS